MSRNTKIILAIVGGLLVLCLCAGVAAFGISAWTASKVVNFAEQNIVSKPEEINASAADIADFDLPQGFTPDYGMSLMGIAMVGYTANNQHIMLMQFPAGMDLSAEEMEKQLKQAMQNQQYGNFSGALNVIEQKPVTIRGKETTLTIAEGKEGSGEGFRQASAPFQGKSGTAFLVIAGDIDGWDQAMVEKFIASIR
jgi:hypothetical protein